MLSLDTNILFTKVLRLEGTGDPWIIIDYKGKNIVKIVVIIIHYYGKIRPRN